MTTTGPYTKTIDSLNKWLYRKWYRQKPPFPNTGRPPSSYEFSTCQVTRRSGTYAIAVAGNTRTGGNVRTLTHENTDRQRAINIAYGKFVDSVNEEAMLLVNAYERKQAVLMVEKSASRMLYSFLLLRKGYRRQAMKALGLTPKGKKWNKAKDVSGLWLEFHFGWEPLIKDIHSAVEILQADVSPSIARGVGSTTTTTGSVSAKDKWWNSRVRNKFIAKIQAEVSVTNPNLHRAAQLGLINPASVAWELIPFSFLVDWFIPVGQFLNSWTDFAGLKLDNAFTTVYLRADSQEWLYYPGRPDLTSYLDSEGAGVYRSLGVAVPFPVFKEFKGFSVTRGATAIALLLSGFNQQLKSDKTRMRL